MTYILNFRQPHKLFGIAGLVFSIQSHTKPPNYLSQKIFEFIDEVYKRLCCLSDQEFEFHRESIMSALKEKPHHIYSEGRRYLAVIEDRSYIFNKSMNFMLDAELTPL